MTTSPLTERSATALAHGIRTHEFTARAVVEAHLAVLDMANPTINAVVHDRRADALAEADAADARIAAGERDLPPLLGVPITVKEALAVEGLPHSCGVVARRHIRAHRTAPAAQRLFDAGAIMLGTTNLSELTMWIESENRVYGRTSNPYNARRIAGGSSGGEGASVGAGIAPIGLGSDVGGSIRIPAYCCGVFGHKPSVGLVPHTGIFPVPHGETRRLLANGPLTRRAEDLMPTLRLLSGPDGEDPLCDQPPALGDPGAVSIAGLRVLISERCSLAPISREVLGARQRAADALAVAGAHVETIALPVMRRMVEPYLAALSNGGKENVAAILAAESAAPVRWRSLRRGGDHTIATRLLLSSERPTAWMPASRTRKMIAAGHTFAAALAATIGDGVLLHPPLQNVAPLHGRTVGRPWWAWPMAVFNLGGVPVTQVPLGLGAAGVPLGVQVVAAPGNDHVAIAVALELERAFGGWVPPWSATRTSAPVSR